MDFAQNRYQSSKLGRFLTTDPILESSRPLNPQTWNRYSFVLNNPLILVDPFGLWDISYRVKWEITKDGDVKIKSVNVIFTKSKEGDDAASLLDQFGVTKDSGIYKSLLGNVEKQLSKGDGQSIEAGKLNNGIGDMFDTIGGLLKDQINHNISPRTKTNGPENSSYNDCSMTTFRLAIKDWMDSVGAFGKGKDAKFGTGDGDSLVKEKNGFFKPVAGNPQIGDLMRLDDGKDKKGFASHYMTFLFTKDDGTRMAFSRTGVNGQFEINNVSRFAGYGPIRGVSDGQSGFYRKK